MRLAAYLVGGAASGAIGTEMHNNMEVVFKLLEKTMKEIELSLEQSENALTKVKCLRDSGKKRKEQTISEETARIDRINTDLQVLESAVLTDEEAALGAEIRDTRVKKQKEEERCKNLAAKREAELTDNATTIAGVTEALAIVEGNETPAAGGGFLSTNSRIVTLLSAKLSPKHREAIVSKLAAARENPKLMGNQMATVVGLFNNILATLEDSKANLEAQKEKEADACESKIKDLQEDIEDKQTEMNAGKKEKAAKEEKKKELEEERDSAETIIKRMETEIAELESNLAKQKQQTEEDRKDLPPMSEAIKSVLGRLKSGDTRQLVTQSTFLQTHSTQKNVGMVAEIKSMIAELIADADKEISETKQSVLDCEKDGAAALEAATAAVKEADAARDRAKSARDTSEQNKAEQEQIQKNLDEQAVAHDEELAGYDATIESLEIERTDNEAALQALKDAVAFMENVDSKGASAAAFNNLTGMLKGHEASFEESVARLTVQIDVQKDERRKSGEDYEATKTSLEADKTAAESRENDANKAEEAALDEKAAAKKALYGDNGDDGLYGEISGKQPQCDKWIREGPGNIAKAQDAINAYKAMGTLIENYQAKEESGR